MPLTKRTRFEVLRRDNHTCRYCGGTAPDVVLTVDHVTPVALGGSDDPSNLVTACKDCNAGKSSTSPSSTTVADVKKSDLTWSKAIIRAADALASEREVQVTYVCQFLDFWDTYTDGRLPRNAENSVCNLHKAGLPTEEMKDGVLIAATAYGVHDRFSYFMGVCWKKVTSMQEIAKQIIAADETEAANGKD